MFAEFAKIFHQKASREGFAYTPTTWTSDVVRADTAELAFQKKIGQDLCIVRLINTGAVDAASFLRMQENASQTLLGRFAQLGAARIFLVNIFAGLSLNADYMAVIQSGEEFTYQTIYPVYWGVALAMEGSGVTGGKMQPADVGGARKLLTGALAAFWNDERVAASHIGELEQMVVRADPFQAKAAVPVVTYTILCINAVMLLAIYLNGGPNNMETLLRFGALEQERVLRELQLYRLFTVLVLHAGVAHFLGNSFGLAIFGVRLERCLGHAPFLLIYLVAGLGGSVAGVIFTEGIAVGASGAIYGLVGAAIAFTWISGKYIDGISMYFLVIYSALGISLGFMSARIGNAAHIGGFITGFALCCALCTRIKKQAENQH